MHRDGLITGTHQHHRHAGLARRGRVRAADVVAEVANVIVHARVVETLLAAGVHLLDLLAVEQHDAFDRVERDGVEVFADRHHQRAVDRHGKRHPHDKSRALTRGRADADAAAELLDLAVDDVETHAAAGDLRDRLGRAEARRQHELNDFGIAELRVGTHEAALGRLQTHRFDVDARTVIADLDDDVATFAGQAQVDATGGRLAEAAAHLSRLDAVIHGVAKHVFQRRDHALEQVAVQLAFRVERSELHILAEL